ncbi:hypothetical protein [Pseudonocardia sp. N23]|uniref:hypothetical protein n=1 Tax=Pseudonocardia sp. N23 TaxID=1987376 RepID=UPI000C02F2DA|nr:hypothetical protein [Pseudonocardia sp. N23]GAY13070.1 hypothetical protein TOK_1799 [Pseudonocardia sp. N23]
MNESQRIRADARDRGLRRASTVTTRTAVGGVAATALAAFVLAQSPAGAQTPNAAADTIEPAARSLLTSTERPQRECGCVLLDKEQCCS